MMWMAGSMVHLFSIGITFSALWQPISTLHGVGKDLHISKSERKNKHFNIVLCFATPTWKSAILCDGLVTNFDSRLSGFPKTLLWVWGHMEEWSRRGLSKIRPLIKLPIETSLMPFSTTTSIILYQIVYKYIFFLDI
ncbi:unnamed protein product [Malus baccata var. baccata]